MTPIQMFDRKGLNISMALKSEANNMIELGPNQTDKHNSPVSSITRATSPWLAVLAAVVVLPVLGFAPGSDSKERVLALKQSLEKDQAELRKYEWIETTIVSYKDEEKSNAQKRCYYGADGVLQKVPVASSQANTPGGIRGRMAKNKKEDITEYMQKAAALIHQYVPPKPLTLQSVLQAGGVGGQILEPGRRNRLDFRGYLLPGDMLGVEVNMTNNKILGLQVATYIDKPEDAVTLAVQFANLANGTGYPAQITLGATKQHVQVVIKNSGYRPVQR